MLFNSLHYLLFFPVAAALHFQTPQRWRWATLLLLSCYFYMSFIPRYILVLFLVIIIDYAAGILLESTQGKVRRFWLLLSIAANVGLLGYFKYFNFARENLLGLCAWFGWAPDIARLDWELPIGLSFHVFQSLAYTIEVYRRNFKAERHLGIYSVYVLYFPQMVAGPIERPQNILPQLHRHHRFDAERTASGLRLILWGLVKKTLIADNLSAVVDAVYSRPAEFTTVSMWIATVWFAVQIYCDFSGYSDIARGSSRVLGIELMSNFREPYLAGSVQEFWSRWHVSLSSWFRDYLYIPLGGSRTSPLRHRVNVLLVFLTSGLWHGANWTYICWGALHGVYVSLESWLDQGGKGPARSPMIIGLRWLLTMVLVCIAWVFFRASSVADALLIIRQMLVPEVGNLKAEFLQMQLSKVIVGGHLALMLGLIAGEFAHRSGRWAALLSRCPRWQRWSMYYAAIAILLWYGDFGSRQFIYFQF